MNFMNDLPVTPNKQGGLWEPLKPSCIPYPFELGQQQSILVAVDMWIHINSSIIFDECSINCLRSGLSSISLFSLFSK